MSAPQKTVVLRVKRRRGEDAMTALIMNQKAKRSQLNDLRESMQAASISKNPAAGPTTLSPPAPPSKVFKLVGTTASNHSSSAVSRIKYWKENGMQGQRPGLKSLEAKSKTANADKKAASTKKWRNRLVAKRRMNLKKNTEEQGNTEEATRAGLKIIDFEVGESRRKEEADEFEYDLYCEVDAKNDNALLGEEDATGFAEVVWEDDLDWENEDEHENETGFSSDSNRSSAAGNDYGDSESDGTLGRNIYGLSDEEDGSSEDDIYGRGSRKHRMVSAFGSDPYGFCGDQRGANSAQGGDSEQAKEIARMMRAMRGQQTELSSEDESFY